MLICDWDIAIGYIFRSKWYVIYVIAYIWWWYVIAYMWWWYYLYLQVDEVVARLCKPTVASQGYTHTSEQKLMEHVDENHSKYRGGKQVHPGDMEGIVDRINKPTAVSKIRTSQVQNGMPIVTE
jgi:hypothetical protein